MRIGIIQGRLSRPVEGFQECPKNWQREFDLLPLVGLTHIEWIVTQKSENSNPIFQEIGKNLPISSICADNFVDSKIFEGSNIEKILSPICHAARKNSVKSVTVPLLEDSSLEDPEKLLFFIRNFSPFARENSDIVFSLETELSVNKISELVKISDNIRLTYDTGNNTSYGVDHGEYIDNFFDKISNVHLKDRLKNGKTVEPGSGDTNLQEIIRKLNKKGYSGPFTMQFCRGIEGYEIDQCKKHLNHVKSIYDNIAKI
jgi:hexulose-6-phosphate isomerase